MQTQEAIKQRHSCRSFNGKPIPEPLIEELIDCARLAPTARNVQPLDFVAITKKETLEKLAQLAENGRFISDCSCCIAVLSQDTKYYLEDGSAATENILLAAVDLGLDSCWVAGDKKDYCEKVKELLAAPGDLKLVSLVALGYSKSRVNPPLKRALKKIIHWEKF
ncbi:MAG: nitroreductase family protein [bacterium]